MICAFCWGQSWAPTKFSVQVHDHTCVICLKVGLSQSVWGILSFFWQRWVRWWWRCMPQQQNGDSKQGEEDNSGGTEGWSYVLNGRSFLKTIPSCVYKFYKNPVSILVLPYKFRHKQYYWGSLPNCFVVASACCIISAVYVIQLQNFILCEWGAFTTFLLEPWCSVQRGRYRHTTASAAKIIISTFFSYRLWCVQL